MAQTYDAFLFYGVACYQLEDYVLAIQSWKHAETHNSQEDTLSYNLALGYFKCQAYDSAVHYLKQTIAQNPKHGFAYHNLAFIYNLSQ